MPNTPLLHPTNGTIIFGVIEEIKRRNFTLLGADIWLKTGRHNGPHSGFGANHIWAEHRLEMADRDFHTFEDVPSYVAEIVRQGTPVHCEFSNLRGHPRLAVVRSTRGTAILQLFQGRNGDHYSVVTAYSQTRAHGTRVGTVR